ncbi:MAG TPA: Hpt domain-containing protein, partial [Gemmataceae bacterium]|nr:Hpt domain-containing protein [Gemmataceae bacterium]
MARQVDREVILGFVAEARDYLPLVLQGIERYSPALPAEGLEEAHRLVHTIKGSASMVGLSSLSHVAFKLEGALEELASGALTPATDAGPILRQLLGLVEAFV